MLTNQQLLFMVVIKMTVTLRTGQNLIQVILFHTYPSIVGTAGFEPATPCTPCKCATRLRHAPKCVEGKYRIDVITAISARTTSPAPDLQATARSVMI